MIWISIILGIIEAIPGLINLIKEIMAAIHGQPALRDKLKMEHELQGHLLAWHTGGGDEGLKAALVGMGHGLKCPAAAAFA